MRAMGGGEYGPVARGFVMVCGVKLRKNFSYDILPKKV